jgi:membrane protein required for colicin V production
VNWLDYIFLAILTLSTVSALRRGFVRETIGLVSTIGGLLLAYWFYGVPASFLEPFLSSRRLANGIGFFVVFGAVVVTGAIVAWMISRFLKATGLSFLDRLMGGVFGLVRGAAICMALLTAYIAWSPHDEHATAPASVVNSQIAPALTEASRIAVSLAPMELKQSFREGEALLQKARTQVAGGGKGSGQ